MRRYSATLELVPAEARNILRDRFSRYLPTPCRPIQPGNREGIVLTDEAALELLLNLKVFSNSDVGVVQERYASARRLNDDQPTFEELRDAGWCRVIFGRVVMPLDSQRAVRSSETKMPAFEAVVENRFERRFECSEGIKNSPALSNIANSLERGEFGPENIGFRDNAWIAARLWDRTYSSATSIEAALREWVDRWQILGAPRLVPSKAWDGNAAESFRQAALEVIRSEVDLSGWEETNSRFVKQAAHLHGHPMAIIESNFPRLPATLVDRLNWFDHPSVYRIAMSALGELDGISGLVDLLLADIEADDIGQLSSRIAKELLALAVERPELILLLTYRVQNAPIFLADFLLFPRTSALACMMVAEWRLGRRLWEPDLQLADDKSTRSNVFADATAVAGHWLERGDLDPSEAAALLGGIYDQQPSERESLLLTLRGEIATQPQEILVKLVTELLTTSPKPGLDSRRFIAAIDIIESRQLATVIDPVPVIRAYLASIDFGDFSLSAGGVSPASAVALYTLATRLLDEYRAGFLHPINVGNRLNRSQGENPYTLADSIARSIRAHARILCRAIVGLAADPPQDLAEALAATIWVGALDDEQKARVGAFSAKFETNLRQDKSDRPIATDLAEALRTLQGDAREKVLSAILETDEPLVLAQMLARSPHAVQSRIRQRITELPPEKAGAIFSLPEIQARISALLQANLGTAAEQFIDAERELQTLGKVGGRALTQFKAGLHLQFVKGDWTGLRGNVLQSNLPQHEKAEAQDSLNFFKGLAELCAPEGDVEVAERIFADLQARHPEVAAYATNLFAAQLRKLLVGDGLARLQGAAHIAGSRVLADAEAMMARTKGLNDFDREVFECNRAIMLLALDRPSQAWEALTTVPAPERPDRVAAYRALALTRLDKVPEARNLIAGAIQEFGETEILVSVRDHIGGIAALSLFADVSEHVDRVRTIREAVNSLKNLDHARQAMVFEQSPEDFIIDHVRRAAGELQSLASSMDRLKLSEREDDITLVFEKFLNARLQHLGWSFADQSRGGFSAKGNPGERDLRMKKEDIEIAIVEAAVCRNSISEKDLIFHFHKLFGYSTCGLLFHVTYSLHENQNAVFDCLKRIGSNEALPEFPRKSDISQFPIGDSRPPGFYAEFGVGLQRRKVVFLMLDLAQQAQAGAASEAAERKSAKSPSPFKSRSGTSNGV